MPSDISVNKVTTVGRIAMVGILISLHHCIQNSSGAVKQPVDEADH
jgi:hypothetical protein